MQYIQLGKRGPRVSRIREQGDYSAESVEYIKQKLQSPDDRVIGGVNWGKTDDETSLKALHQAVDCGVNFFDTADVYGWGHSEELIASSWPPKPAMIFTMLHRKTTMDTAPSVRPIPKRTSFLLRSKV